jgi:hypothetical protein
MAPPTLSNGMLMTMMTMIACFSEVNDVHGAAIAGTWVSLPKFASMSAVVNTALLLARPLAALVRTRSQLLAAQHSHSGSCGVLM